MLAETQVLTESMVYWITRLDYLQIFLQIFGGALLAFAVAGLIVSIICHCVNLAQSGRYESNKKLLPVSKKCICWSVLVVVIGTLVLVTACFCPTTKEMCAIKALPMIVNNEDVQELPNKVVDLANEWIDELKPVNIKEQ